MACQIFFPTKKVNLPQKSIKKKIKEIISFFISLKPIIILYNSIYSISSKKFKTISPSPVLRLASCLALASIDCAARKL